MGQLVKKVELRMKDTASNIEMTTHLNRNQNEAYLPECNESEIHYESKWPNENVRTSFGKLTILGLHIPFNFCDRCR